MSIDANLPQIGEKRQELTLRRTILLSEYRLAVKRLGIMVKLCPHSIEIATGESSKIKTLTCILSGL